MADDLSGESFIITSKAHHKRVEGFPIRGLDCHGTFEETFIGQMCTKIEKVNLGKL